MSSIVRTIPVTVPAEAAWLRLADVGAVNRLLTFLGDVTVDGDTRTCALGDLGTLREIILSVDEENRRVAYTIVEAPLPFTHHSAAFHLQADGAGGTVLSWTTDFLPAELRPQVEALVDQGVQSLTEALGRA
ncbi:SRPBCC family protein [Aquipuribacter nitratireducens]|uniref:SRPBCC family protein n=1 Tax=Aquipuribacter nitratireducens TaxID=650104 RepID=A0ABW0GR90_9MICO